MADPVADITILSEVPEGLRDTVLTLAEQAESADGVAPLDDQVRLDLRHERDAARYLVRFLDATAVAYGHLDLSDTAAASAHLVTHPAHRRHGHATALLAAMAAQTGPDLALRVWAHGDLPPGRGFAEHLGLRRVRELWQMTASLGADLPVASYPDGVRVRPFEPGRDEAAWVAVNAAAFSRHPEQGRLTVPDLEQRMQEPWFDPEGFFLAEREGELLGYHWTKVHPSRPDQPGPVGEVYVLGVSPAAQGLGLGSALTATGLHHLHDLGLDTVILYVEGDNRAAIAVYEKMGMRRTGIDVMYERR